MAEASFNNADARETPASMPPREPSPFRPLLVWLGAPLGITNICFFPCAGYTIAMIVANAFAGRRTIPAAEKAWLLFFEGLSTMLAILVLVQALLATICLTWSLGNYWRRLSHYWLMVLASTATVVTGFLLIFIWSWIEQYRESIKTGQWHGVQEHWIREASGFVAALAALPMLLLAVQLPFWLARHFAGYRIIKEGSVSANHQQDSLALRDLFVATAMIAVSLGVLQFGDHWLTDLGGMEQEFLFAMIVFAAICCGVSLIVGLPLTIFFLRCKSLPFAWGVTFAIAGVASVGVLAIYACFERIPNPIETLGFYCAVAYSFAAGSAAGLTILRRAGWRLVSRRSATHG